MRLSLVLLFTFQPATRHSHNLNLSLQGMRKAGTSVPIVSHPKVHYHSLITSEETRNQTQALEVDARAALSSAEGEANAISAEVSALAKILERDTMEGGQVIDRLQVEHGFEKALGAALADDLRSPQVQEDGPSGWISLEELPIEQDLPAGVTPLTHHVSVPEVLNRRISQIGLVDADDGPKWQRLLKPGQRLVSTDGDLWRWDGFRAWSEDAPTATSLRLEQLNRLEELKQLNERANVQLEASKAGLAAHGKTLHFSRQCAKSYRFLCGPDRDTQYENSF